MKNFFRTAGEIIKEFATRNWGLKIASLVCAFLIWCFIVAGTNPDRIKTVNDVPLRVEGIEELEAKGLCIDEYITQIPQYVTVNVNAGVDYHNLINNTTVTATINLSSINKKGEVTLNISCTPGVSSGKVSSISPSSVTLTIDEYAEMSVPVEVDVVEPVLDGYYLSNINVKHDEITIKGAYSRVSQVAKAVAYVDASDLRCSESFANSVVLLDKDGNELKNITQKDSDIHTIIEAEVMPVKRISISSESIMDSIINVAKGCEVYGAVANPAVLHIAGDEETISQITELKFDLIDAQNADKSVVLDAKIKKIQGITLVDGDTITVYAQIRERQKSVDYSNLNIELRNIPDGYTAKIDGRTYITATVSGGISSLSRIKKSDIQPYIDLSGASEGRNLRAIKIDDVIGADELDIKLSSAQAYIILEKK